MTRWLLVFWFCVAHLSCHDKGTDQPPGSGGKGQPGSFLTTDQEILTNLEKHLGLKPVEKGGGGRCLFHSLREQITQAELVAKKPELSAALGLEIDTYDALNDIQKADLLRKIAIYEERDFLVVKNNMAKAYRGLRPADQAWALEMAKDWHEEFEKNPADTRAWFDQNKVSDQGLEDLWQYVIANKDAYWAKTGCDANWAGTSEAIVFARLLKRPLRMYGLDRASLSRGALLDDNGVVLPYVDYNYSYPGSPLLIFQVGGGGHYQMLVKNTL